LIAKLSSASAMDGSEEDEEEVALLPMPGSTNNLL
jgi:hypothetical protein